MSESKDKQQYSEKNIKNMKVAIFCISAILVFYIGVNLLKGLNIFSHKTYYYAVFEDAGGLHESTTVNLNGYPIGKVTKVSLLSSKPVRICAQILINEQIDIPSDSRLEVVSTDVLGGMGVNLVLGNSSRIAHDGDTLASLLKPGMTDGLGDLIAQLQSVVSSVDTIGQTVKTAFLPQDQENGALMLKATLVNLEASTRHLNNILATNETKVGDIVNKLNALSTTLNDATPQINSIVQNLDQISDSIARANINTLLNDAQSAMANVNAVTAKIESGEGTAGQLINNDSLYQNVNKTLESLNILIQDIKANPSKYINVTIFGKNNKKK